MIQRMSDQHKISFLSDDQLPKKNAKSEVISEKTLREIAEEQKSKRLYSKDDGFMTSHHISSAITGDITNEGSPSKFVKSDSSNTIWDANKTVNVSKEIDNKTKTIQEKAQISTNKRDAEQKRMDTLADALKSTLQGKSSSVSPAGILSGTNFKVSKNNMSIFDNSDFARVKDQTDGEKVSEDVESRKNQVDNSWRGGGKVLSSTDLQKKLLDDLFS